MSHIELTRRSGLDQAKDRIRGLVQIAGIIRPEDFERERELHATKWFDYRFISPVAATHAFAVAYQAAFKANWAKHEDQAESMRVRGLSLGWRTDPGEFTSLWRARQHADLLGVPYWFYVQQCFDLWRSRRVTQIPRPNQLYAKSWLRQLTERIQAAWAVRQRELPHYSILPQYQSAAFREIAAQIAHVEWSRRCVDLGANDRLFAVMIDRGLLSEAYAEAAFGRERVERAKEQTPIRDRIDVSHLRPIDFVPSCAFVPGAHSISSPQCLSCHFKRQCAGSQPVVMSIISRRHGSLDPRAEALKNRKRLNQQAKRERDAAAKIEPVVASLIACHHSPKIFL